MAVIESNTPEMDLDKAIAMIEHQSYELIDVSQLPEVNEAEIDKMILNE